MDRFWSKVDKTPGHGPWGDCWLWTASTFRRGYGAFKVGKKQKKAHRVALELSGVDVPDDLKVCHTCDMTGCCNPAHLFLGTHQDNVDDMVQKNRHTRVPGENHGAWKLSDAQVDEIKARKAAGAVQKHLAQEYGVSEALISLIVRGMLRKHKTPDEARAAADAKALDDSFKCCGCGVCTLRNNHFYMVTDEIWTQYGAGHGMLCLDCLTGRMGRKLELQDLSEAPLNRMPEVVATLVYFMNMSQDVYDWAHSIIQARLDEGGVLSPREYFWKHVYKAS
jgi:transcriptional regulator with XRE-family HTH domain